MLAYPQHVAETINSPGSSDRQSIGPGRRSERHILYQACRTEGSGAIRKKELGLNAISGPIQQDNNTLKTVHKNDYLLAVRELCRGKSGEWESSTSSACKSPSPLISFSILPFALLPSYLLFQSSQLASRLERSSCDCAVMLRAQLAPLVLLACHRN